MRIMVQAAAVQENDLPCDYWVDGSPHSETADIGVDLWGPTGRHSYNFCDHHYSEFSEEILDWLRTDGQASTQWYPL